MAAKMTVTVSTGSGPNILTAANKTFLAKLRLFAKMLVAIAGGLMKRATVTISTGTSTGTITLASVAVGTVVEINGEEFVAISGTPVVANGEFDISGSDTADATSLVAAITGSTSTKIAGVLTATSALGVVTITPVQQGLVANAITLTTRGATAGGIVTCAAVQVGDTFSINGTAMTATQQNARATATFSTIVAGNIVTLNGVAFTAATAASASNEFTIGASDTTAAAALAAAVNACSNALINGIVTATSAAGVVTFRAVAAGTGGNAITLTKTGSPIAVTGSGFLAGGAAIANNQFDFGGSDTQTATSLAYALNNSSSALVSGFVKATSAAAVVAYRAKVFGIAGNAITTASSDGTRLAITGSAARMTGGTEASELGAQATGTIAISGGSGNYTCTINGVNASGTVAFNTSDTQTAADLADAINKSTNALVAPFITATAATGTLTVTAIRGGVRGNAITFAGTGTGTTVSAARLTGGAAPLTVVPSGARITGGTQTTKSL